MPRKLIFYAWLSNRTSREDDEPIKIKAENMEQAEKIARFTMNTGHFANRFGLRGVYTAKEFAKYYRGWPKLMSGSEIYERSDYGVPEIDWIDEAITRKLSGTKRSRRKS